MAAPLEDLDRILQNINATERQRCFLRSYLQGEGLIEIRHLGPRAPEDVNTAFPRGVRGHIIAGRINGRDVQIIVGDGDYMPD